MMMTPANEFQLSFYVFILLIIIFESEGRRIEVDNALDEVIFFHLRENSWRNKKRR